MKTTSINEALYSAFGNKKLTKADFAKITQLTITQYSLNGVMLEIDFSELMFFPNLKTITIKDCALDDGNLKYIFATAKSFNFMRCDFSEATPKAFPKNLEDVYISDCEGVASLFNNVKISYFEINKSVLDQAFCPKTQQLFIAGCSVKNFDFLLSPPLKKLTISLSQYKAHKKLFDNAPFNVIVLESNGQFVAGTTGGKK